MLEKLNKKKIKTIRRFIVLALLAVLMGGITGIVGTLFKKSIKFVSEFRNQNPIIILLLPVQVTLVPFFIFFNTMHLMESRFPLIAFCSFSPFGAFLMYQFIRSIPDDSIEAARLEGASEWRIFWRIVFPQATPGIAALTILTLIDCFSMIEQPFMLLREKSWYPMSIMLKYLSQQNISEAFVLAVVFVIPVFLAYLLLQDYLIEGISHTAPGRIK